MNIENVVLVRAMNHLPFDGILVPSCEGQYLTIKKTDSYYYVIKKYIQKYLENQMGRSLNVCQEDDQKILEDNVNNYLPLTSTYTSTLSFALNGLVPDDINNTFSNMKIAVLEPIKYHQQDNFVNIDAIDTTIKGSIYLSKEAILVIEKDYFLSLDEQEKNKLLDNYRVEIFDGTLKDAVSETLQKYNFPSLSLIQRKEHKDILDCPEKESMLKFQDNFAQTHNVSRLKLQQLYMYPISSMSGADVIAAEKVKSDFDKNLVVEKYYIDKFYSFLISQAENIGIFINEEERFYLFSSYSQSEEILEALIESLIKKMGLENFRVLIEQYNSLVKDNYITNDEIINLNESIRR